MKKSEIKKVLTEFGKTHVAIMLRKCGFEHIAKKSSHHVDLFRSGSIEIHISEAYEYVGLVGTEAYIYTDDYDDSCKTERGYASKIAKAIFDAQNGGKHD